jgi:hypothetical protein
MTMKKSWAGAVAIAVAALLVVGAQAVSVPYPVSVSGGEDAAEIQAGLVGTDTTSDSRVTGKFTSRRNGAVPRRTDRLLGSSGFEERENVARQRRVPRRCRQPLRARNGQRWAVRGSGLSVAVMDSIGGDGHTFELFGWIEKGG